MRKFKTRLISVMLMIAMIFSLAPAGIIISYAGSVYDEEAEEADFSYGVFWDGTVEITEYKGNSTAVIIPDTLGGKRVTSIGYRAFEGCSSLESINVAADNPNYASEDGVLYNKAKTGLIVCPGGKKEVTIPDGVTRIGHSAFRGCSGLESITIPASVTSMGGKCILWL